MSTAATRPDVGTVRLWRPRWAVDLHATLGSLRRGAGDPAYQVSRDGGLWRTTRTTTGPATLRLGLRRSEGVVMAEAWGAGANLVLDALPAMLGADDDPAGFDPRHGLVRDAAARFAGWRVPRTGMVLEALVPAVLEQKVTGTEARRSWRELLRRYGEPAPGPAPAGMRVVPSPGTWRRLPSWEWHRAGVDPARSRAVVAAAGVAARLESTAALADMSEVERLLRLVPGVGAWTAAETRQRAHGDADAVSVGDFHLCRLVGWALTGRAVDDDGMLDLLEPYRGHRYRAVRMIELSGFRPPRFGPRYAPRDYRRI